MSSEIMGFFNDRENKLDKIEVLIFNAKSTVTKLNLEVNSYYLLKEEVTKNKKFILKMPDVYNKDQEMKEGDVEQEK